MTFVLVGDDQRYRRFTRKFWKTAQPEGVDALFRMVGFHEDMPASLRGGGFRRGALRQAADLRACGRRGAEPWRSPRSPRRSGRCRKT